MEGELPLFSRMRETPSAPKRLTVSELTGLIRGVVEPSFTQVWVQGEVSNFRPAASGHIYFSLKDQGASISAALFGWGARKKSFDLKDGLQVLCRGKISVYPPRGSYQLVVDQVEAIGAGALQIAFEQLKAKLAVEGLFEAAIKRPLPRFPTSLAVVTSPTGAAIQDMLNILKRRAPHLKVVIVPALVQGEDAPAQLIRGLEIANHHRLGDVIVLARGGGSIEDLWCFNHEGLARAIRKSAFPVVSAVGHEIDFTISDFVSDLRAPTPSAAAEIVTSHWVEAASRIEDQASRLKGAMLRSLTQRKVLLSHLLPRLISPKDRLREQAQRTDEFLMRLERALRARLERKKALLGQSMGKLDALSPLKVLERGYTLVRGESGLNIIKSAKTIQTGQELKVIFYDGETMVRAI